MEQAENSPISQSNPEIKNVNFINKIWQKIPFSNRTKIDLILIFVLIIPLTLFLLFFDKLSLSDKQNLKIASKTSDYLQVVSINPYLILETGISPITVAFNHPVEAHHIFEYVETTPNIDLDIIRGKNSNEIKITPKKSINPGNKILLTLKAGLPSENGKKLLRNYSTPFEVRYADNSIYFYKNGLYGKFMSFDKNKGADLTINIGKDIKKANIKIFKANASLMINSLLYSTRQEYGSSYKYKEFIETPIDTTNLEMVEEKTNLKNEDLLNFKNDTGLYLFQALDGDKVVNNAWVTLNETGIHLRQDDQKIYLAAQNLPNLYQESGINVKYYSLEGKPTIIHESTLNSIDSYEYEYPKEIDLILAQKGQDIILIPIDIPNSQAIIKVNKNLNIENEIFIYTDRPVYKKTDSIKIRGIVRTDNDALFKIPPEGTKVKISTSGLSGYNNNVTEVSKIIETTAGGIFSTEISLPPTTKESTIYLYATTNVNEKDDYYWGNSYTYFDVSDYKKPDFDLKISLDDSELTRGDEIKAKITGKYFSGKPLSNETITYELYKKSYYETEKSVYNSNFNINSWGGMCGGGLDGEYFGENIDKPKEVKLSQNGEADISFNTKDISTSLSQEVTIVARKKDKYNNEIFAGGSVIVHNGEINIFIRPNSDAAINGEQFKTIFYAEDQSGNKITDKEFNYELSESYYDYSTGYKELKTILKQGLIKTNDKGIGVITESHDSKKDFGDINVDIYTTDARGNKVESRRSISLYNREYYNRYFSSYNYYANNVTLLKISSDQSSAKIGGQVEFIIESPKDMKVLLTFDRGRVYDPKWIDLKKGTNSYKFDVSDSYAPSITPTFSFFHEGKYYLEGLSLNVPALHKLVNLEISTDKNSYKTNENAIITITTKDSNNNPVSAKVSLGIVDKAIYALKKDATPALHSTFYEFRPRNTNASSSLTWIATEESGGGGGGGGGDIGFKKDIDTLYWNPSITTDQNGRYSVSVPLYNQKTTYKINAYASTNTSDFGQKDIDLLVSD